jgi:putative tryptophan/tyrosine transport system substrate-binding protein
LKFRNAAVSRDAELCYPFVRSTGGTGAVKRRDFITLLGGASAWPLAARAQQAAMPVIGFLNAASSDEYAERLRGFHQGLKDEGFVEGENVAVEYRWADNQINRVSAMAAELVRRQVGVIAAVGGNAAPDAAKTATTTIPILFITPDDPVKLGLVTNLARPSGNLTGITFLASELGAKRLELLRELVPSASRVAILFNPASAASESRLSEVQAAARTMGMQIQAFSARASHEIDLAFPAMVREGSEALLIIPDPVFSGRRIHLVHSASRHRLPAIYWQREFAAAGGLMSYGSSIGDAFRQVGRYSGRILKGAKPADLPVVQSEKFELVINHQIARLLGLTIPSALLIRADEVIE